MLVLFYLETVLSLMQDRCTVCAERTIGSKIILRRTRSSFGPFLDGVSVDVR